MVSTTSPDVALARLAEDDRQAVVRFRHELRALLGPRLRDLRLYGSKVRGDDHDESDIDMLVLVDSYDGTLGRAISDLAYSIDTWLAPNVVAFDAYHAPSSRVTGFYQELRKESVKLL